jgi:dUTP pyrophosphatase
MLSVLSVLVRRLRAHVALPAYQTAGAAGFDFAAAEDVRVEPGAVALIPTGLVIRVPDGYFLGIFARSSTPLKRGLIVSNGVGVIDSDYCGASDEIKIQVLNVTRDAVTVRAGDRIAQGLFIPVARAAWQETTDDLRAGSRGGFGATG